ncbi:hypothetical protein C2S49_06920 [Helicobacter pylori]|nr:hypothetical protein C2S49_06920 [Helicobacter pylori]
MIVLFNKSLWSNPPKGFLLIGLKTTKPYPIFFRFYLMVKGEKNPTIKPPPFFLRLFLRS